MSKNSSASALSSIIGKTGKIGLRISYKSKIRKFPCQWISMGEESFSPFRCTRGPCQCVCLPAVSWGHSPPHCLSFQGISSLPGKSCSGKCVPRTDFFDRTKNYQIMRAFLLFSYFFVKHCIKRGSLSKYPMTFHCGFIIWFSVDGY